jgi:RNA polymerase sigma-70 factor (ECF subfamily)
MSASNGKSKSNAGHDGSRLEAFIARAKSGSTSALGRALDVCRPQLLRSARRGVGRKLRPLTGASDVVQDTFVNATRGFTRFRGARAGEFVRWLRTILAHRLAEIARRATAAGLETSDPNGAELVARQSPDPGPSPSSLASDQEHAELIRAALLELGERDRQALRLRFEEGLTFRQMGLELKVSEDAARMLFARAVKRLRRRMRCQVAI